MVQATDLKDRVIIRDFPKTLECVETGSIYTALSADVQTKHGFPRLFGFMMSLAQAPSRKLYDVLDTSGDDLNNPEMVLELWEHRQDVERLVEMA